MFNSDWLAKNQSAGAAAAADAAPAADAEESAFFSKFWGGGETGEGAADGSSLLPTTFGGSGGNDNFLSLSRGDRFKGLVLCLLCSAFFFLLGFFVGLPTLLFAPAKFAFCSTMGSLFFMAGFALIQGPAAYIKSICSRERAPFSVCFFGSMATTLYASLVIHSYFVTVAASGVEMAALFWYLASYVPGGKTGMMMFTSMFFKTVRALAGPCFAAIKVSCAGCLKLAGRSSS